jgi:uncharacterized protein (TIGR03437 family)
MVAILGAKLSREEKSAEGAPLPEELGETKVYVAGRLLPLRKVSEGKVEVHLPLGIAEYTTQQVIVQKGKSYSPPEAVLVVGTEPGIFTVDESGSGQGQVYANTGEGPVKADNARPARAGEDLFIYCTGLGPVDGDGNVTNPISVTIEGKEAYVSVAAQIGEIPGTYLVMVQMPEGLETSASAQVVIRAGEQTSQTVTMAVQ